MSVYKRKSGQWAVRVDVDRDADGRRVRKNLGTFPTRKAAESAERKALEARERGVDFDLAGLTVGEACDRFLDRCRAKSLAPASLTRYAEHFRDLSGIRDTPIGRLTRGQVSGVYQAAAARNLSPKSLRVLHGVLRAVVAWAAPESPSLRALTLAARDLPSVPKTLARALDEGEVHRLLAAAAATPWEAFLVLAICTGARRSELAALRWDDIDFAHRTAKVARSLAFDEQGNLAEKSTKTGTERYVSLNVLALETLRAHRANQAEERLRAGPAYEANNFIFADPLGRPWNPPLDLKCVRSTSQARGDLRPLTRLEAQLRELALAGRNRRSDRCGDPRPQHPGHDPRHLRPRHARSSGAGRRADRRSPPPSPVSAMESGDHSVTIRVTKGGYWTIRDGAAMSRKPLQDGLL